MSAETMAEIRKSARKGSAADHGTTIRAFYPFWDTQYRPFLIRAVEAFPLDRLDFKPRPEMLTAREIIIHIAEAERAWLVHVIEGGIYEEWVVPAEDPARGWRATRDCPDHASLLTLLEEWHRPTQRWLAKPASELSRVVRDEPRPGLVRHMTIHWILDHVQEHEIHHRAQLNLYLRLLGVEPPSI